MKRYKVLLYVLFYISTKNKITIYLDFNLISNSW